MEAFCGPEIRSRANLRPPLTSNGKIVDVGARRLWNAMCVAITVMAMHGNLQGTG